MLKRELKTGAAASAWRPTPFGCMKAVGRLLLRLHHGHPGWLNHLWVWPMVFVAGAVFDHLAFIPYRSGFSLVAGWGIMGGMMVLAAWVIWLTRYWLAKRRLASSQADAAATESALDEEST